MFKIEAILVRVLPYVALFIGVRVQQRRGLLSSLRCYEYIFVLTTKLDRYSDEMDSRFNRELLDVEGKRTRKYAIFLIAGAKTKSDNPLLSFRLFIFSSALLSPESVFPPFSRLLTTTLPFSSIHSHICLLFYH